MPQGRQRLVFQLEIKADTHLKRLFVPAQELGTTGNLTALRRLEIGPYSVQNAFDGNLLKGCETAALYAHVEPVNV